MPQKHPLSPEHVKCLDRCGSYDYYHHLRSCYEAGKCPFCNLDRNRNKILKEDRHMYVWEVPFKIKKAIQLHVLVVPTRCMRFLHNDMTDHEWESYRDACRWVFWKFPELSQYGGMEATRFGNMFYNAGTVLHAHTNFKVPVRDAALREPISKDEEDQREDAERAFGYAQRFEAGEVPQAA